LANYPDLWGIYIGDGCVTGDSPLQWRDVDAHAHNNHDDEWFGWICIANASDVVTEANNPTVTLKHEIAHMLCPNQGHTKAWRKTLTDLGAAKEASRYERSYNGKRSEG
jgi:hypothetical protein